MFNDIEVRWETRLCTVDGETGYFHTWEHFSKSGVMSIVSGIVEFEDGVRRVDPTQIKFCDEQNEILRAFIRKE